MEENGANIIQVPGESEQTAPLLVIPHLNPVVVTPRHEHGLGFVEVKSSHGAIMFFEAVYKSAHTVVPELDCGRVKGHEDPWSTNVSSASGGVEGWIPFGMECNSLGPRALGLKLCQHARRLHFGAGDGHDAVSNRI